MSRKIRGSGFKHTLASVFPFSAVWVFLVVLTAPIISIGMMVGGLVPESLYGDVWFFLATRVPILALAAIGLAIRRFRGNTPLRLRGLRHPRQEFREEWMGERTQPGFRLRRCPQAATKILEQ